MRKELGTIFQRESLSMFGGGLITITVVRVTSDLSIARVYLSIFSPKSSEEVLQQIRTQAGEIRYKLGSKVRHQLRKVPELEFFIDDSLDYAERIDELLDDSE